MEAAGCYEAMVDARETTQNRKPENCVLQFDGDENVAPQI
jgi:hypothetical protein